MKTIVIGLGNPVLGDDGVGWRIVETIQQALGVPNTIQPDVDFNCLAVGGLSLMEHLIGYEWAILVDALSLGRLPLGDIYCLKLTDLPDHITGHTGSAHDTSLQTALQMGKATGANLPDEILVVGVETHNAYEFSEKLSPQVEAAIPRAVLLLKSLLRENAGFTLAI